jgi:prepilin-type N-terminal cleavage/methylation domain-containing protein
MNRPVPARRAAAGGFTLVEVLVAMMVMAIAVFPSLEIIREAEKNSFDAKYAELCTSKMRSILAWIVRTQKPGTNEQGDFANLSADAGGDDRSAYANIKYEWRCDAVDLSLDITPAADQTQADKDAEEQKRKNQDEAQKDAEKADSTIDERFRARYIRMVCTYVLDSGEERKIIVETYVPAFPSADKNQEASNGSTDLVPPNGGGASSKGGGGRGTGATPRGGGSTGGTGSKSGTKTGTGTIGGK